MPSPMQNWPVPHCVVASQHGRPEVPHVALQAPSTQLSPAVMSHIVPHLPQLSGSVLGSLHTCVPRRLGHILLVLGHPQVAPVSPGVPLQLNPNEQPPGDSASLGLQQAAPSVPQATHFLSWQV
jgi:hypothetical protein